MDAKLANWIFVAAGGSWLLPMSLFVSISIFFDDDWYRDPIVLGALVILVFYIFSLCLLHMARNLKPEKKLIYWWLCLGIHVGVVALVYTYADIGSAIFAVLIAEVIILSLMCIGIVHLWRVASAQGT